MARNEKSSVSNLQNEEHKRILTSLLREEGNRRCADCNSRGPTWASVNLGVFVCLNCSGIHRSLGVHISKVRSTNLDTWLPEQVAFVQAMGNVRCNKYWEANLPRDFHRPPEADMAALRVFITDKYVNKRYALQGYRESPCIENYMSHPFIAEELAGGKNENGEVLAKPAAASAAAVAHSNNDQQASRAAAVAAVPQFDLLSLDDDPTPAPLPQQQQPAATSSLAGAQKTAAAGAAAAADWDPFAAIAREPMNNNSSSSSTAAPTAHAAPAAMIDPFAEIERTASTRSSVATTTASSLGTSTTATAVNGGRVVVDPFALPPPPPPSAVVKSPPSAQGGMAAMASAGSIGGSAPMRSGSSAANGHSKGNLSHEDILAMFDK